ncbi:MAG: hypothetical protein MI802_04725 [Desulfobacterales bacterium]|nr:hypothetical protein [Desulfobacterales bacterium]
MNDRVENLFSPERLEKRWQRPSKSKSSEGADWQTRMAATGAQTAFNTLSKDILKVVKGERRKKVIAAMLEALETGLAGVYQNDGESPVQDEDILAIIMEIQKLEDMLEAFLGAQGDLRQ